MNRLIQFRQSTTLFLIILLLAFFALPQRTRAVSPAPDGGYPGGNTAEGKNALLSLTTGGFNTAVGYLSLGTDNTGALNTGIGAGALLANTADEITAVGAGALLSNTTGPFNTATGAFALLSNTTGSDNTALGSAALESNTTGVQNTAVGSAALVGNTGSYNTAVGYTALFLNTTGSPNSAFGWGALKANTSGSYNTAFGYAALYSNTTGGYNTAVGDGALFNDTTGGPNTATGTDALYNNVEGAANTATGFEALLGNTTGANNTADGNGALASNTDGNNNTAVGGNALDLSTGTFNTALGYTAGHNITTATNVICIAHPGQNVDNTTWLGNVYNVTTQSGTTAPVVVSDSGQLGTVASSERFKKDIATMNKASETILSLRPVTFHYKTDTNGTPQFGLIAEEVAKINPALVLPDKEGKPYTVRYDAVNAMLLNEFLKEHRTVDELRATVAQQQKQLEAMTAGLQKVSAQLELNKAAPQTVLNGN